METLTLEVEPRPETGKGAARRARAANRLPAVFYGPSSAPLAVSVPRSDFEKRLAHLEGSHLIQLKSSSPDLDKRMVLMRDIQLDPLRGDALHADFYEVALDKELELKVALHFTGKAEGVTLGGILQPILREITVSCLPTQIPDFIAVDVTKLGIHDALHISQLALPEGVKALFESDDAVVSVVSPTVAETPGAGGAEAGAAEAADAAKKPDAKKPEAKKAEGKK